MSVHLSGDAEPLPQWNAFPVLQPGQPPGPHLPQPQVTRLYTDTFYHSVLSQLVLWSVICIGLVSPNAQMGVILERAGQTRTSGRGVESPFCMLLSLSAVVISCPVYPRRCFSFRSCECSSSATTSCVRCRPPYTPSHTYDSWYDFHTYPHTRARTRAMLYSGKVLEFP